MRDYTPTADQRDYMADLVKSFTIHMDQRSNTLRDWYNKGQQAFRFSNKLTSETLHDFLENIEEETHREGFLMGWRADEWAYMNGKERAVLGTHRMEVEMIDYVE
jgi:hypothetical protein